MKSFAHQYTQKLLKLAYPALFSWFELIVGCPVFCRMCRGEAAMCRFMGADVMNTGL